ncbi:hypothetical protein R1sor_026707 [Riccia sorocarpa]|uniref:Uncharacterized protein n=1 Tax=Riccia sorocarpa TaxID=122646 RepID=A0ABD3GHW6_9MARC
MLVCFSDKVLHELQELRRLVKDAAKEDAEKLLQSQLEQKEAELLKLQEEANGMAKKLKSVRKKSKDMRKELKRLPTGVVMRSGVDTLSLLQQGGKLPVALYPQVVDSRQFCWGKLSVVPALGHPDAYAQGVPMVEEIIRLWELSAVWTCSHAMHSQTRDLSTKGKKKLAEGQSEEDVGHRCVEFPPLPEEVASWFIES